jgi:hypothetical protein
MFVSLRESVRQIVIILNIILYCTDIFIMA